MSSFSPLKRSSVSDGLPACLLRAMGSSQDQACPNTCWLEKPGKQAQSLSLSPKPSECWVWISANSTSTQESQMLKTFSI